MNTLQNIYFTLCKQGYCSDKGNLHSYIDVYAELLDPYRHGNCLEIGLLAGHSLRMWEKYFEGYVWGIDCSDQPIGGMADLRPMIQSGEHNIVIMNAEDINDVTTNFSGLSFDIIIEDAGHHIDQQLNLYNIWKDYLNPGGIYIIEDIQNLDADRASFENIDPSKKVEIKDRRGQKGRYDDILVVIRDK